MTRGLDRITSRLDHVMITGPRSIMGHHRQETNAWLTTTMEINHVTAHRRPLNGAMAHHQQMVHNGTSRDLSSYHQGWDDDNEVVGFVVRWDVIPGITHRKTRPQNQSQQFREPSAPQQRQGSPSNNNAQAPGNNFRGPRMGTRTPSPARPAFQ